MEELDFDNDELDPLDGLPSENTNLPAPPSSLSQYTNYLQQVYLYICGAAAAPSTGKMFALSHTSLSRLCETPLDFYKYVVESKFCRRTEPSDAMLVGAVADDLILGRHFDPRNHIPATVPMPLRENGTTYNRQGAANKAEYQKAIDDTSMKNHGAMVVPFGIYHKGEQVAHSLIGSYYDASANAIRPWAELPNKLISGAVKTKVWFDYFDDDFQHKIVGEIDLVGQYENGQYYMADIKSMDKVSPRAVQNRIKDRRLQLQAAIYRRAAREVLTIEIRDFYFIVGHTSGNSYVHRMTAADWSLGEEMLQKSIQRLQHCLAFGASALICSYEQEDSVF